MCLLLSAGVGVEPVQLSHVPFSAMTAVTGVITYPTVFVILEMIASTTQSASRRLQALHMVNLLARLAISQDTALGASSVPGLLPVLGAVVSSSKAAAQTHWLSDASAVLTSVIMLRAAGHLIQTAGLILENGGKEASACAVLGEEQQEQQQQEEGCDKDSTDRRKQQGQGGGKLGVQNKQRQVAWRHLEAAAQQWLRERCPALSLDGGRGQLEPSSGPEHSQGQLHQAEGDCIMFSNPIFNLRNTPRRGGESLGPLEELQQEQEEELQQQAKEQQLQQQQGAEEQQLEHRQQHEKQLQSNQEEEVRQSLHREHGLQEHFWFLLWAGLHLVCHAAGCCSGKAFPKSMAGSQGRITSAVEKTLQRTLAKAASVLGDQSSVVLQAVEELQDSGAESLRCFARMVLSMVPVGFCCNNPDCRELGGLSELGLVQGPEGARGVCGGCGLACYCSRECQEKVWYAHRNVCMESS